MHSMVRTGAVLMQQFEASISLEIRAPFLFPGVQGGLIGYDRMCLRNSDNTLIMPHDQLRGLLRHGLGEIGCSDIADRLFGMSSDKDPSAPYDPRPGLVFLSDLVAQNKEPSRGRPYFRVRIDDESGAADEGHLLAIEQPFPPEKSVKFAGDLILYAQDRAAAVAACESMELAFSVWDKVGAHTSIGFGRISQPLSVSLNKGTEQKARLDLTQDRLIWEFELDRPYIVDSERPDGNTYSGAVDIPGGALKGVLARVLALRQLDVGAEALTSLRIGFASHASVSPIPLSIVKRAGERVDVSGRDKIDFTPVPQVDWKSGSNDDSPVSLLREERVHTAISEGAAKDTALFSEVSIVPGSSVFSAELDISTLDEKDRSSLRAALACPMPGLGRTNATITTVKVSEDASTPHRVRAGKTALVLNTKGLLADFSDGDSLIEAYSAFWSPFLPNSTLTQCFAEQVVVGAYLARRFGPQANAYRPWVLTKPGSVFVFDLAAVDVDALEKLCVSGVCRETLDGETMNWRNCPFVATNGYGSIAIHAPEER